MKSTSAKKSTRSKATGVKRSRKNQTAAAAINAPLAAAVLSADEASFDATQTIVAETFVAADAVESAAEAVPAPLAQQDVSAMSDEEYVDYLLAAAEATPSEALSQSNAVEQPETPVEALATSEADTKVASDELDSAAAVVVCNEAADIEASTTVAEVIEMPARVEANDEGVMAQTVAERVEDSAEIQVAPVTNDEAGAVQASAVAAEVEEAVLCSEVQVEAEPAAHNTGIVALPAQCLLRDAAQLKQILMPRADDTEVSIDTRAVERIDTAAMQVLLAFVRDRHSQQRVVNWLGLNEAFVDSAHLLGIDKMLGLPANEVAA